MITPGELSVLVYCALAVVTVTPVALTILLILDYKRGKLW
jgi:hypothetical protein